MDLGKNIRSGVGWLIIGNTGSRITEFVFGVVLARLLVPADFGMIVTIQVFTGFVGMLAGGGMGQALVRSKEAEDEDFTAVFTLQLAIAIPIYLGFYFSAPWFAAFFGNPLYEQLVPVSALMFFLRPVTGIYSSWLNRDMKFKERSLIGILSRLVSNLVSIVLAWYGFGVWSLTLAGLVGGMFTNLALSFVTPLKLKLHFNFSLMRKHGEYGSKIVANDFFTHVRKESLKLILSKLAGPTFLGLFNKAESLHRLPYWMLGQPVAQPVFRAMSKAQDNLDQTKYMFYRVITLLMVYVLPFFVGMWWVAHPFIQVVYGEKWMLAAEPLKILSLAGFFYIISRPSGLLLMAQNRLKQQIVAQAIILVFTLVACYLGLEWDLVGVSWAFLFSQVFTAFYFYLLAYFTIPTRLKDLLIAIKPGFLLNVALFSTLWLTDYFSNHLLNNYPELYLLLMVFIGGSFYAACVLLIKIPALETEKKRILEKLNSIFIIFKKIVKKFILIVFKLLIFLLLLAALGLAGSLIYKQYIASKGFIEDKTFPLNEIFRFYDLGIVDANNDGRLDIFTANHHFRQYLLIQDEQGAYQDQLFGWQLGQSREFPRADLTFTAPVLDEPGLYIYWYGTKLLIRSHKMADLGKAGGKLEVLDPVNIEKNKGFVLDKQETRVKQLEHRKIVRTVLEFSADKDAYLRMMPGGQGLPLNFTINEDFDLGQVYVGLGKVSPKQHQFSLTMLDRHAMAWADYNSDGLLDIFIDRGALSGTLRAFPDEIRALIKDELLIRKPTGGFDDITRRVGIEKKDCSGRHARWLDFNHDGLLDLFVNCYDRDHVPGDFPKQLYIQNQQGNLEDRALAANAGLSDQQMGSFAWFDVDDDGDIDLVSLQNEGFFLHRNEGGVLNHELIHRRQLSGKQIGSTAEAVWLYDGKITIADYDNDGDLDFFASSKRGNFMFANQQGHFSYVEPSSIGLPEFSMNAQWVDYDNDGLIDLQAVPQGLFKQDAEHRFHVTDVLAFNSQQYQAAVSNWFDMDNDGLMDMIVALNKNLDYKPWWEFNRKHSLQTTWYAKVYRNRINSENHWLQVKLIGNSGNKQAIGARVTIFSENSIQTQEVGSSEGAFFSQGHYRLYFGLGKNEQVKRIRVRWSNGQEQTIENINVDQLLEIKQLV